MASTGDRRPSMACLRQPTRARRPRALAGHGFDPPRPVGAQALVERALTRCSRRRNRVAGGVRRRGVAHEDGLLQQRHDLAGDNNTIRSLSGRLSGRPRRDHRCRGRRIDAPHEGGQRPSQHTNEATTPTHRKTRQCGCRAQAGHGWPAVARCSQGRQHRAMRPTPALPRLPPKPTQAVPRRRLGPGRAAQRSNSAMLSTCAVCGNMSITPADTSR